MDEYAVDLLNAKPFQLDDDPITISRSMFVRKKRPRKIRFLVKGSESISKLVTRTDIFDVKDEIVDEDNEDSKKLSKEVHFIYHNFTGKASIATD